MAATELCFPPINLGSLFAKGGLPRLGTAGLVACTGGPLVGAAAGRLLVRGATPERVRQAIIAASTSASIDSRGGWSEP